MSKQIITVSREFGSGGRTVGKRVAELLGVTQVKVSRTEKKIMEKLRRELG